MVVGGGEISEGGFRKEESTPNVGSTMWARAALAAQRKKAAAPVQGGLMEEMGSKPSPQGRVFERHTRGVRGLWALIRRKHAKETGHLPGVLNFLPSQRSAGCPGAEDKSYELKRTCPVLCRS